MKMHINGDWTSGTSQMEVRNPYTGEAFDTVPAATLQDVALAINSAARGAKAMRALSAFDRYEILTRAVALLNERKQDMGETITQEEGKILSEGLLEVDRWIQTMTWSAEEAKRLFGETIPLDAAPDNEMKFGFTLRVPVGVVAAIAPFNFPLNLVAHKVGPAIAGGNAVVIKPASDTPLSALKLTEVLIDAGLPAEAIQCVTGSGGTIGDASDFGCLVGRTDTESNTNREFRAVLDSRDMSRHFGDCSHLSAGNTGNGDEIDEPGRMLNDTWQPRVIGGWRRQVDEIEPGLQRRHAELSFFLRRQIDDDEAVNTGLLGVYQEFVYAIDVDGVVVTHEDDGCVIVILAKTPHAGQDL